MFKFLSATFYKNISISIGAISELEQKLKQLKIANQKLERNSRSGNVFESVHQDHQRIGSFVEAADDSAATVEETTLIRLQQIGGDSSSSASSSATVDGNTVFTSVISNGADNGGPQFYNLLFGVVSAVMIVVIKLNN